MVCRQFIERDESGRVPPRVHAKAEALLYVGRAPGGLLHEGTQFFGRIPASHGKHSVMPADRMKAERV
jgi:hypothetical protein